MTFDPRDYWESRHRATPGLDGVGFLDLQGYNDWMYRVRDRVFRRAVAPFAAALRGGAALDVGSGTGFYLQRWAELEPARLVGSDLSEVACQRLRAAFPRLEIRALDVTEDSDAALDEVGRFDFVSMMDVLFHIVDDAKYARAFHALARLLKPDGRLVFTENFLRERRPTAGAWLTFRSAAEIEAAARDAGLVLETRQPAFILMNAPVDSDHPALRAHWWGVRRVCARSRRLGETLGALTYPLERGLTRWLKRGPSTHLAVARRAR